MNVIHSLDLLDKSLFLFFNGIHSSFFDGVMFAISGKFTWIPLYIAVLYVIIERWKKDGVIAVLAIVLCLIIADQLSSHLIKELVHRLRPSHAPDLKGLVHLVRDYTGGAFGFVSSHAANSVGFAMLTVLIFKRSSYSIAISFWAFLVGYSRVYIGVHYPFDVIGGVLVGLFSAFVCFELLKRYHPTIRQVYGSNTALEHPKTRLVIGVLGLNLLFVILYSLFIF
jgi:undecaprenyl-diphosphatase